MRHEPLSYYVDRLKSGKFFSMARYGDGELYCMWGKNGRNSNGCYYTPELRKDLLASLCHNDDETFIYGLQRVLPQDRKRAETDYPVNWFDSEIFGDALVEGKLYPLIAQLRLMKTVVIGHDGLQEVGRVFYYNEFISVPPSNAHEMKQSVIKTVQKIGPAVYLFSCGMAANAFISELHGMENTFLLDVGHIWDPFVGNLSRCNLEGLTKEQIERNLYP